MINARDKYDFVTIPDEIRIDGGIMPARDVAADGSWKQLRGEDAAFILEAVAERRCAVAGVTVEKTLLTREINGGRLLNAVYPLQGISPFHRYCKTIPSPVAPAYMGYSLVTLDEAFDASIEAYDRKSRPDNFMQGNPLVADEIRRVYLDLGLMRQFYVDSFAERWDFSDEVSTDHIVKSLVEQTPGAAADDLYLGSGPTWSALTEYKMKIPRRGTDAWAMDLQAAGGTYTAVIPEHSRKYISDVRAFVLLEYYSYLAPKSGDSVVERGYSYHEVDCVSDGGTVTVPHASVIAAAEEARSHYNPTLHGIGDTSIFSQLVRVSYAGLHLLCSLTDHTDFHDIGWNWNP